MIRPMKNKLFLTAVLVLASTNAFAQTQTQSKVKVDRAACEQFLVPGAGYTPGVDVYGKKVAGADLPQGQGGAMDLGLPETITFDFGVDLATKYGLDSDYVASPTLGKVTVNSRTGAVTFNGKRLDSNDSYALKKACQEAFGSK